MHISIMNRWLDGNRKGLGMIREVIGLEWKKNVKGPVISRFAGGAVQGVVEGNMCDFFFQVSGAGRSPFPQAPLAPEGPIAF